MEEVVSLYTKALAIDGSDHRVWMELGRVLIKSCFFERAAVAFHTALGLIHSQAALPKKVRLSCLHHLIEVLLLHFLTFSQFLDSTYFGRFGPMQLPH